MKVSEFTRRLTFLKESFHFGIKHNYYRDHFSKSINPQTRENFWREQSKLIDWIKEPPIILDQSNPPFYRWFPGGILNTCYNCVDRHAKTIPNNLALIFESAMTGTSKHYSYKELLEYVSKTAGILRAHGVKKGDRVIIYMPMIPEAIFSILACARIGAVHSVVFGGFAGPELASRIEDADPKLLIYGSCGLEPNRIIDYQTNVKEALKMCNRPDLERIVLRRPELKRDLEDGEFDFYEEMYIAEDTDPVPVYATDYLYILYTSGTTGTPKGIVRDNGGNAVALSYSMRHIMNIKEGDVYFSCSDIGWVVGHSFTTYGPLLAGATTLLFEGKPIGTPDAGTIWRLCEKHGVKGLYSSPTAMRVIRKYDPEGSFILKAKLEGLKMISIAGERLDEMTFEWLKSSLPKHVLINDNYWQTETGWSICSNFGGLHTFHSKPGSCTKPVPGMQVVILGKKQQELQPNKLGTICVKLPMPPSFMPTLYRNDTAFVKKYLSDFPGYYNTGDSGYFDEDGYLYVVARTDDIINTAGHRLSTAQMEEVCMHHKDVTEAAVVSQREELKGEVPVGFLVLKIGHNRDPNEIEKECLIKVRNVIGPVASFKSCIIVDKLPKTRSGKILRNALRALINGENPIIPPTIEDPNVINEIKGKIEKKKQTQMQMIQKQMELVPNC